MKNSDRSTSVKRRGALGGADHVLTAATLIRQGESRWVRASTCHIVVRKRHTMAPSAETGFYMSMAGGGGEEGTPVLRDVTLGGEGRSAKNNSGKIPLKHCIIFTRRGDRRSIVGSIQAGATGGEVKDGDNDLGKERARVGRKKRFRATASLYSSAGVTGV